MSLQSSRSKLECGNHGEASPSKNQSHVSVRCNPTDLNIPCHFLPSICQGLFFVFTLLALEFGAFCDLSQAFFSSYIPRQSLPPASPSPTLTICCFSGTACNSASSCLIIFPLPRIIAVIGNIYSLSIYSLLCARHFSGVL